MIDIRIDRSEMAAAAWALRNVRNGSTIAVKRSVNKALKGVKTDMARETAKELALPQKRIKKDITIHKEISGLSGRVESSGRPVNLEQFKAKQKKKGVSVKVLKKGKRKTIPGAFIFLGRAGKTGKQNRLVGWRKKAGPGGGYVGTEKKKPGMAYAALPDRYRFPIETLYGPRIQDITSRPAIMKKIEDNAGVRLIKELDHQVDHLLKKSKGII